MNIIYTPKDIGLENYAFKTDLINLQGWSARHDIHFRNQSTKVLFVLNYDQMPNILEVDKNYLFNDFLDLLKILSINSKIEIVTFEQDRDDINIILCIDSIAFMTISLEHKKDKINYSYAKKKKVLNAKDIFIVENVTIFYLSELLDDKYKMLFNFFTESNIDYRLVENNISLLQKEYNELVLSDNKIESPVWKNIDLHYGEGFEKFYDELCRLLIESNRGIVMLHGQFGAGKTHAIKKIIEDLNDKKKFLYVTKDFMDEIHMPNLLDFFITQNQELKEHGKNIVLIIEDADNLLVDRNSKMNSGIANILNISDGILNDLTGLQIICTFNTEIDNIDPALLRSGRLIAKKEFKALTKEQAEKLIKLLGIKDLEAKDGMVLSDIYSNKNKRDILTHGEDKKDHKKEKLGFL